MKSIVLLPTMSGKIDFIGEPVKAIGYDIHKTNKRTNTICIYTTNMVGRFWLQGSLKQEPREELDWFNIPLSEETPYIEFNNFDPFHVTHDNRFINVNGNYTWFRGKLDRTSYLKIMDLPTPPFDSHSNIIDRDSINADYSKGNYIPTPLNPIYDPMYYKEWHIDHQAAYTRSLMSYHLGNIEKVLLCY